MNNDSTAARTATALLVKHVEAIARLAITLEWTTHEIEAGRASLVVSDFERLMSLGALLQSVADETEAATAAWAVLAGENDASWSQIARPLGITKQRAHQRYAGVLSDRSLPGIQ